MTTKTWTVRELDLAETYELRRRVLRNNDPGAQVHTHEDDRPDARHFGAVSGDEVVAAASFYPIACRVRPDTEPAYQLRFMAVHPAFQGRGIGHDVLAAAMQWLRAEGARLLWANARDTALRFYVEQGFETVGDSFREPATGLPHTIVVTTLD